MHTLHDYVAQQLADKIKSRRVVVWYDDVAAGMQALVSGEVDYAFLPNGRVLQAKAQGAPVDFEYGEAFLLTDLFVIPKGAPDKDAALDFVAFASTAEPLAAIMRLLPYSAPNQAALKLLVGLADGLGADAFQFQSQLSPGHLGGQGILLVALGDRELQLFFQSVTAYFKGEQVAGDALGHLPL